MNRITIKEIDNYIDKEITVQGFVDNIRDLQYVQFVILRDSTDKVQLTIEKNEDNKTFNELFSNLTLESTIKAKCKVISSPSVKLRGLELLPIEIEVTSESASGLPFDNKSKDNSLRETRLDYRFIDLRREENILLFKAQSYMEKCMRDYWYENNYTEIHTPKISASAAESGAEMFKIDYFGKEAVLSQSPQFYKQMSLAAGFDKVFEVGPVFRAENSHTSYHASEFMMIDEEIAYIDGVEDVMNAEEGLLKYTLKKLDEKYGKDIEKLFKAKIPDISKDFPRITFKEAKDILKERFKYIADNEYDLDRKEEKLLCIYSKEQYGSEFIFITQFPYEARPFYHMVDENGLTKSYDLLYRGIELTTGSQREHRPEILTKQIKEKGINPSELQFYIDFFKYGCPPHGGYAIGLGRLMMQTFNIDNLREASFIYRGVNRLNP